MTAARLLTALLVAGVVLTGVLVAPLSARATTPAVTPATSASAPTAATPIVSGNTILDSTTGSTWTPHAVNWPSFEYACQQGWAEAADGRTPAAAAAMVSWGINAVRIPLNQDCWLGVDGAPAFGTVASYRSALASWVATLNAAGLVVILDLHWTAPTGFAAAGQRAMPDAQSVTFWSQVSAAYTSSPSVLFETFNEPYSRGSYPVSWGCWKNGGCQVPSANDQSAIGTATYTAVGQAALVSAIRATGATQPILLDGLNYANDITGWLANKPSDSQLIASWHNYPGQGCSDTTCWNSQVAPLAASIPVITTEFGMTDTNTAFITGFMTWADAHGIGYAPWAWWITDSSDGAAANLYSLISDLQNFTPRAPEGTSYFAHLAALGGGGSAPAPLPLPPGSPIGSFDSATVTAPGAATVSGWAIDPDTAAAITTRLYVDGLYRSDILSSTARPDLAAVFPAYTGNHGWSSTLSLSGGTHTICAYGLNTGVGGNSTIGCRTVSIPTGNPFGSFDAAAVTSTGTVSVSGWDIDPDTASAITTHVYVDGVFATLLTASNSRPDVAAAFPLSGAAHGWSGVLALGAGAHTICAYGINVGAGSNSTLGCRTVSVPTR